MVSVIEEAEITCVVRDPSATNTDNPITLKVPGTLAVGDLVRRVASELTCDAHSIELVYSSIDGTELVFNESSEENLLGSGIRTDVSSRNLFIVQHIRSPATRFSSRFKQSSESEQDDKSNIDHDRVLRHIDNNIQSATNDLANAQNSSTHSVTYTEHRNKRSHKKSERVKTDSMTQQVKTDSKSQHNAAQLEEIPYNTIGLIKQDTGYVGLVNQAMTCYLNSLLQALYMTPEFRNALYKWQYLPEKDNSDPAKCIPYQLQKLFLNLQTSYKSAVETTELTKSFGWDSSEAWQQHDIQELCRVMFDALEHTFKNTDQADLIDRLYQGKMLDYVKCLECGKEKSREDTFLDIPLPVRPFGSTVAYKSIEEALKAFVQPETLDGTNQYSCESCNKKCDAHKGLKFTKFPYLLTLHLKRFDFDYSTMHRIKLNDKVTFPENLYLNDFIEEELVMVEKEEGSEGLPEELAVSKCDDSSTTDSGSALDDEAPGCQGTTDLTNVNSDINQDDDEGIDVSGGNGSNHLENEKNRQHGQQKGPYEYELFSIMIHSGSASGGHYYAYIKDFSNGEWWCFNDTSVSRITNEDIAKTYGGGALRTYYSGAYSSSTNAYMLMYRQKNESLNCNAMKEEDFPEHIKNLYKELQDKQDMVGKCIQGMVRLKVYCQHPKKGMINDKVYVHNDSTLEDVTKQAYENLKLDGEVDPTNCRLVSYNSKDETIDVSYDGKEEELFLDLVDRNKYNDELLLEIKNTNENFIVYKPGELTVKAFWVDIEKEEIELPPITLRCSFTSTVGELKANVAAAPSVNLSAENVVILTEKYPADHQVLTNDQDTLKDAGFYQSNKVYACAGPLEKPFHNSKVFTLIDRFEHVITLHFTVPDTDPETLSRMSIPSLSSVQVSAGKQAGDSSTPPPLEKVTAEAAVKVGSRGLMLPLILAGAGDEESGGMSSGAGGGHSDQSASEDSSLTDSDRTLRGDVPDECLSDGENQISSPPEEEENSPTAQVLDNENWDEEPVPVKQCTYFKAEPYEADSNKMLKVRVDKRMTIDNIKAQLEQYVGVPASCFKLLRPSDCESTRTRTLESLSSLKTNDTVNIKLGRQLTSDEHKIKVHQLVLNSTQPIKYLCDWIIAKGITIGQSKKEIIDDVNRKMKLNLQYNKCRLRKKNWKNVGRIFQDSQVWVDDVVVYSNGDIFLQEVAEPDTAAVASKISIFVKHWHPSTLTLDPFQEILLDGFSVDEFKLKLSQLSSIPVENIDFAKPSCLFPCDMSVLTIQNELEWNHKCNSLEAWPLQINDDGGIIFFRDNREELKELTPEERSELSSKETARLNSSSVTISGYSPRKERPLKIYLDRRPSPAADLDVD